MNRLMVRDPTLQWQAWCQTDDIDSQGVNRPSTRAEWLKTTNLIGMGR